MENLRRTFTAIAFACLSIIAAILLLAGCTTGGGIIIITATPPGITATPTPTLAPSPTQEIWNEHQRCAATGETCIVNGNSNPFLDGPYIHNQIAGRNVTTPAGWSFNYTPATLNGQPLPPPFVYCNLQVAGCQYEFHFTAGAWTLTDTLPTTLYRDTAYLLTVNYTLIAPGCIARLDPANMRIKARLFDSTTGAERQLAQASIASFSTSTFSEWALIPRSANITDVITRLTVEVDYPACTSDARLIIHSITWRAIMPESVDIIQEI